MQCHRWKIELNTYCNKTIGNNFLSFELETNTIYNPSSVCHQFVLNIFDDLNDKFLFLLKMLSTLMLTTYSSDQHRRLSNFFLVFRFQFIRSVFDPIDNFVIFRFLLTLLCLYTFMYAYKCVYEGNTYKKKKTICCYFYTSDSSIRVYFNRIRARRVGKK